MMPLTAYLRRFLDGALEKSMKGPVLVVEPRATKMNDPSEHQFRTESGVGTPMPGDGETYVLEIRKHKNNAFQRGVTLGRTSNNDLVVPDGSVSRFHAWFQQDPETGAWCIADSGSKNGTKVGSTRLLPKKPAPLKGGERLRFGKVDARFCQPRDLVVLLKARMGGDR
jgi:pSer/pThr/pTyr-binding forkhead associated (FHA) protein